MPRSLGQIPLPVPEPDAIDQHCFEEHGLGPHPHSAFTIEGAINDHLLACFAMQRDAEDFVQAAFEVAIFSGDKIVHGVIGGEVTFAAA